MSKQNTETASAIEKRLVDGMPTRAEMAHASSVNAAKHRAWEIAKREDIQAWKAARRVAGLDTNMEAIRPE